MPRPAHLTVPASREWVSCTQKDRQLHDGFVSFAVRSIPLQTGADRPGLRFFLVQCSETCTFSSSLAQRISKQIKVMEDAGQGRAVFPVL